MKIRNYIVKEKALSIEYLIYRVLRPLLKINYWFYNKIHPNRPWLTPDSIKFLESRLDKTMIGLEYGSGRSTIFFAKKLKKLVSIEHHSEWYKTVEKLITDNEIDNVEYFFIPNQFPNITEQKNNLEEVLLKLDGTEERNEFFNYFNKVNDYPDDYFDFVLIDGRARVHCGTNAIGKLKSGGIFILDNSERPRYGLLHELLEAWKKLESTTGLTNTTIWIKP